MTLKIPQARMAEFQHFPTLYNPVQEHYIILPHTSKIIHDQDSHTFCLKQ